MARLPFNPDLIAAASAPPPPSRAANQPLTVTQLAGLIRDVLAQGLPQKVRVIGQISNLSTRTHWFFNLKDGAATIRCVCFASNARRISFPVQDGHEVIATGRVDFFDQQGNVQLYVDKLEPVGVGELELRFRALCEELRQLGYFAVERKKPLPAMPRCVAVVTSRSGAALQDVINTAHKRWPGCRLLLYDVLVQGAAAAPQIAAAIEQLSRHGQRLGIDAVILTRGGGSMEDLWAFNERIVADAIFRCPLPIIAAIGHETDTTIAELVADLRCATPTQAAMTLIPDQWALTEQIDQLSYRLRLLTTRQVRDLRQRFDAAARHALFRRPMQMYEPWRQRLTTLTARMGAVLPRAARQGRESLGVAIARLRTALPRAVRQADEQLHQLTGDLLAALPRLVAQRKQQVEALASRLESVNPSRVLERGYSYTLGPDGHVLKSATAAKPGDRLTTVLRDGRVSSRVEGQGPAASAQTIKRKAKKPDDDATLF